MANFNINKTILGGRIASEIELKQTQSGIPVCSFSIAVNRRRTAEGKQETDFINCVAWRNTAEFISKYFSKGSSICIAGNIQTRTWEDQNRQKRYATEVIVDEVYFVDSKSDSAQPTAAAPFANPQNAPFEIGSDDDLPF